MGGRVKKRKSSRDIIKKFEPLNSVPYIEIQGVSM